MLVDQGGSNFVAVNLLIYVKGGVWLFWSKMRSSLWGMRPGLLSLYPNLVSQGVTWAWLASVDNGISRIFIKVCSGQ